MTKEDISMKFSDYIRKQGDEFRKAGDGYEALSDTSKACIDYAVQRFVDECAAKQQAIAFDFWKRQNGYTIDASGEWYIKLIVVGDSANTKPVLANEVYNQFIEQQNKQ